MAGVLLLFAASLSLVINLIEKKAGPAEEAEIAENEPGK